MAPGRVRADWQARLPKVRWTVPLTDDGFAGPAVAGGVVYIVDHRGQQDVVRALDLRTGRERWRFAYPEPVKPVYGYARATPAIRDGLVYTLSRQGKVHCLEARTGKLRWTRDIKADFHGVLPQWGYSASPFLDGDALILCPGGKGTAVVALDRRTGKTRWQGGGSDTPGYATPTVATLAGTRQYLIFAEAALLGVEARTGKRLWRFPWTTPLHPTVDTPAARAHLNANAAVPYVHGNTVFITTGYGHGSALLDLSSGKLVVKWTSKVMQSQYSTPVGVGQYVYAPSDPNHLVCLDLRTGKAAWRQEGIRRGGGVIAADGKLMVLDGGGTLHLVRLTPTRFEELGRLTPLGGESRTAPILADGTLLVRNRKALACVELR